MAIDVKPILEEIGSRSGLVDSTSSTQELYDLYKTGQSVGGGSNIAVYETEDDLPFLLDATPDIGNLAFVKSTFSTYVKDNQGWKRSQSAIGDLWMNGSNYGFTHSGGGGIPSAADNTDTEKYSFSSQTNSVGITGFSPQAQGITGFSSKESAYITGGEAPTPFTYNRDIDKMPFSSETASTVAGQVFTVGAHITPQTSPNPGTQGFYQACSTNDIVGSRGYVFAGDNAWTPSGFNTVSSFLTSTDVLSQAVGNLNGLAYRGGACNDTNNAYVHRDTPVNPSLAFLELQVYSFANNTLVSNNIVQSPITPGANNSPFSEGLVNSLENGYVSLHFTPQPAYSTGITKFPFATSPVSITNVGDISNVREYGTANSSISDAFFVGGRVPSGAPPGVFTVFSSVDRFPFASEGTSADHGDMVTAKNRHVGTNLQY